MKTVVNGREVRNPTTVLDATTSAYQPGRYSTRLLVLLCSGALPRGDGGEGRPALFYLVTAAVRAGCLFRVMLCHSQNLLECFLAGVTEELIVGHTDLPQSKNGCSWILDP
jgi:hypothetical protein